MTPATYIDNDRLRKPYTNIYHIAHKILTNLGPIKTKLRSSLAFKLVDLTI